MTCLPVVTGVEARVHNDELIPYVLHVRSQREPSPERALLGAPAVQPPLPRPTPIAIPQERSRFLSDDSENAIRGRLHVFTAPGFRLRALLDELNASDFISPEAFPEAAQTLAEWPYAFANLPRNDRQGHMDALAILLLRVVRPVILSAENGSAVQEQALIWDERIEEIFQQLFPQVVFEASIEECEDLMREEELIHARSVRLEHTAMVQERVFAALEEEVHASIDQTFTSVRQRLIDLQATRRLLNREAQVDVLVNRVDQAAENLFNRTTAIAQLSLVITQQEERCLQTLTACKNLLERPL